MKASELKAELAHLNSGLIEGNSIVENVNCYFFIPGEVVTYNDKVSVIRKTGITYSKKPFGVNAGEFYSALDKLGSKKIKLELKRNKFILTAKGLEVKFTIVQEVEEIMGYMEALDVEAVSKKMKKVPDDFSEAIDMCSMSVAKADQMIALTGLFINGNKIVGSDRFRVSEFIIGGKLKGPSFILPRGSVLELSKFTEIERYYNSDGGWVYFKTGKTILACRKMAGEYPDTAPMFDIGIGRKVRMPMKLFDLVDVAEVMCSGDFESDKLVEIKFGKDFVRVMSAKDSGEVIGKVECKERKGKPFNFRINPGFLKKIFEYSRVIKVGKDAILFEKGSFKHSISLR